MARGRKRKPNKKIPEHIDQGALPRGIYFDKGRWFRYEACPHGGRPKKVTVASETAMLSDLHAIMEAATGGTTRGTVAFVFDMYLKSLKFKKKAADTQRDYLWHDEAVRSFPTRLGVPLGRLMVDKLSPPVFQKMVDAIAEDTPSKANHMLRYARLAFSWGVTRGHCKTNPAKGVAEAEEKGQYKMPTPQALAAVIDFARARGRLKAHSKGSCPPYLAPAIEITYGCRLRGIEVNKLTDAHNLPEGIQCDRTKGSKDNITAWNPELRAAWAELVIIRTAAWHRKRKTFTPPTRPELRFLIVNQSGTPLAKSSLETAWQRLMRAAIAAKVIDEKDWFTLHGLKHRSITDSRDKSAAGHKTKAMQDHYDHELTIVEPATPR